MRRLASMPLMPGMLMSMRTSAGASSSASSSACSPLSASPTASNSGVAESTARAARRNGAWSSTIKTRTGVPTPTLSRQGCRRPPCRHQGREWWLPPAPTLALPQIEQHRLDPPMHVGLLGQPELGEHRVDVLFDRSLAEHKRRGDGGVVLALRHLGQHVAFARREPAYRRLGAAGPAGEQCVDDLRIDHRPTLVDGDDGAAQLIEIGNPLLE